MNEHIILWGGIDINPAIYKQPLGIYTNTPNQYRDQVDIAKYKHAIANNIPVIGICRGAQLAHALNGGTLTQDITNHTSNHLLFTRDNESFYVNSSHHQLMNHDTDGELIAWATHKSELQINPLKNLYKESYKTPEIIFYPKTKTLCIQYHPEWMAPSVFAYNWTIKLIKNLLNVKINLNQHETHSYYLS